MKLTKIDTLWMVPVALAVIMSLKLSACSNTYRVTTKYSDAFETREVTSEVKGKGTIKEVGRWYEKILKFANDEVMFMRRKTEQ